MTITFCPGGNGDGQPPPNPGGAQVGPSHAAPAIPQQQQQQQAGAQLQPLTGQGAIQLQPGQQPNQGAPQPEGHGAWAAANYGYVWNLPQWVPTTSMALFAPAMGYQQYAGQYNPASVAPELQQVGQGCCPPAVVWWSCRQLVGAT